MSTKQQQLDYMERYLVYDIFKYFGRDVALLSHSIECSNGLDGFMSALYTIQLDLRMPSGSDKSELVLVKFMKGSKEFRESSKSYTQCANEIFLYAKLLPAFENLLRSSRLNTELAAQFVPRSYWATYGTVEALGDGRESVLALQHLRPGGYELGPRLALRQDQLEAMSVQLGQFHALGYAMRIVQPQLHERLQSELIPLPFVVADNSANLYAVLYRVAFDRFYEFYDRCGKQLIQTASSSSEEEDARFADAVQRLRTKYFEQPIDLLEHIRSTSGESHFSTFLHGDFNRNNVLFHEDDEGRVDNIKMIDFQEMRYSTVAIDISFYLYMNIPAAERLQLFPKLLRLYHGQMLQLLELLLQRNRETLGEEQIEQLLTDYSYEQFEGHFKRYAFYGVMICMHFLPWLLGSEADCDRLSKLFETDMHGAAFHQLSMEIAGDEANRQIFNIMRHAFDQGYMDSI
ncbi:uncharacterized protein LOC6565020 [Drosophila grimshawi]|uniref:GH12143 n=1 Tax=Drosophila grimshawi TaxID=7222 RepID=B4JJZ8_DROGR|nr:uncharacterized protein LOC6565020 [Drosophila grimshawi]EDV99900.1 GH12143 [Drosophila grimshawi]